MKLEVNLDKSKEKEILDILNKRMDGVKPNMDESKKKELVEALVQKALIRNPKILNDTLEHMGNGEFFDLVKDC